MKLFVSAAAMEFRGFLKRCTAVRRESLGAVWARSGLCQGKPVLLLANGAGAGRAHSAVLAALSRNPALVCSVGFCGALDPELKIGGMFVAHHVNEETALEPRTNMAHVAGRLVCSDHVVQTVREKRGLHEAGYGAVDMESAGAQQAAHELGIPFYAVKAVSDLATEELRCDYNRALRDDGSIDLMSLSLQALARPFSCLPDLIRFGRNASVATEHMGEFLAGCEF